MRKPHTHTHLRLALVASLTASTGSSASNPDCTDCLDIPAGAPLVSGGPGDQLGESVDILGDRAVFGAPAPLGDGYVVTATLTSGSWSVLNPTMPLSSPGSQLDERFGDAVAMAGDLLVVGAPLRDSPGATDAGRVSIFQWTGSGWTHLDDLVQPDSSGFDAPEAGAQFGDAVDLWHDPGDPADPLDDVYRLIVGASNATHPFGGLGLDSGRAFIFESLNSGFDWTFAASLESDPNVVAFADDDRFGAAVALDGDLAIVGAPEQDLGSFDDDSGLAFVAERDTATGTWTLLPPPTEWTTLQGDDRRLGASVAIRGELVAVGAPGDEVDDGSGGSLAPFRTGTVRIAEVTSSSVQERQRLSPQPSAATDGGAFGRSVSLGDQPFDSDALIVGAPATMPGTTALPRIAIHLPDASEQFRPVRSLAGLSALGTSAAATRPAGGFISIIGGESISAAAAGDGIIRSVEDDPCEQDCNDNGIPDQCEIAAGISEDCDGNGVLDSCEISSGLDCDMNGLLDACDLQSVEIVWVIDPSGSTGTKGDVICGELIAGVEARLRAEGRRVSSVALYTRGGSGFDCIPDGQTVFDLYGSTVPLRDSGTFPNVDEFTDPESWAAASAVAAEGYPWQSRLRIVVPISDECAWQGSTACDSDDEDSIDATWAFLACRDVFAFPIQTPEGSVLSPAVTQQMDELALRTSGTAFAISDLDSPGAIQAVIDAFAAAVTRRLIVHDFEPFDPATGAFGDGVLDICDLLSSMPTIEDCNRNGISDRAEIVLGDPNYVLGTPISGLNSVEDEDGDGILDLDICESVVCIADLDGDFEVSFADLLSVLSAWGPCIDCPQDLAEPNGVVDFNDVLEVLSDWGSCYQNFGPMCTIQALPLESPPASVMDCLQKANWDPVLAAPCIDAINMANQH